MRRLWLKNKENPFSGFLIYFISFSILVTAQKPVKQFTTDDYNNDLYSIYKNNKSIPDAIESQALIALSFYPELKNRNITFRFCKRKTPLSSRPRLLSLFKRKKNRMYVITISTKTTSRLSQSYLRTFLIMLKLEFWGMK